MEKGESLRIDSIPEIEPSQLMTFDQVDTLFFSNIGYKSISLSSGKIILPTYSPSRLTKLSADVTELLAVTENGRGPGELLSMQGFELDGNSDIYVYDFRNQKIVSFDSTLQVVVEEGIKLESGYGLNSYLPLNGEIHVLQLYLNSPFIIDDDVVFKQYDYSKKTFGKALKVPNRPVAWAEELGLGQSVPFTPRQLAVLSNDKGSLFLFNTNSEVIAEVNADFDTLRTIPAKIPTERISASELETIRDSIFEPYEDSGINISPVWDKLKSMLPDIKTPIEEMKLDWKGRFWLKSNLSSGYDQWFVLDRNGNIEKIVNLPKNSYLTHISEHHLGVRLKDHVFGLYETVN